MLADKTHFPIHRYAQVASIVLAVTGAAVTTLVGEVDWTWLPVAATAIAWASGIVSHAVTGKAGTAAVTPEAHVVDLIQQVTGDTSRPDPAATPPQPTGTPGETDQASDAELLTAAGLA